MGASQEERDVKGLADGKTMPALAKRLQTGDDNRDPKQIVVIVLGPINQGTGVIANHSVGLW